MESQHVGKKNKQRKKKTPTCSSLESMRSCLQYLAWLTMGYYQPGAMDASSFHVETSRLRKRVKYDLYDMPQTLCLS